MRQLTEIEGTTLRHECNAHCTDGYHSIVFFSYEYEGDDAIDSLQRQMERFNLQILHYRRILEYNQDPNRLGTRYDDLGSYWTDTMWNLEIKEVYEVLVKAKAQ